LARPGEGVGSPPAEPATVLLPGSNSRRLTSSGGGVPTPSRYSPKVWLVAACAALAIAGVGCGAEEGVAGGATVSVYVASPLCAEAERVLAREGGRAGDVRVRIVCLPSAERDGRLDLATIGANARRATQDTSAVGYIGEPTRAATRFSEPILESARVAQLSESSGAAAMTQLLRAIGEADTSGSLRESVNEELN
jgi:hypothetical protein